MNVTTNETVISTIEESPCTTCPNRQTCTTMNCPEWREWFSDSWKEVKYLISEAN